jgi:hypothetical protein
VAETVVVGDDDSSDPGTAAESAHQAAVAEGATGVQTDLAQEAADQATAAAEIALGAAEANIAAGAVVESAVATADGAAAVATVSAEMVQEALAAQTAAIHALTEELALQRKAAPAPDKPKSKPAEDASPGKQVPGYYRKIGG